MPRQLPEEVQALINEAERRVRAGVPRAEVAHALGIPTSTLAGWAHKGGWRRMDLIAVRDAEHGQMILGMIDQLTAAEHEKKLAEAERMREALEASRAELDAVAPAGRLPGAQLPGSMGEGPVPAQKLAMAMADSLLRQGRLEDADRAVRLAVRFAEAEQAAGAREEAKWREERERLTKWWAEKQTAYHKLHIATDLALQQMVKSIELETSRSADQCCPKCNRRMDFWPEEVERPHDGDSGDGDSGSGKSGAGKSGAGKSDRKDLPMNDLILGDSGDDDSSRTDDDDFLPVAVP